MISTGAGREARRPQPPSRRQEETLELIRHYMREHGVAPSRTEVAEALGVKHRSTADVYLTARMKKGWGEVARETRTLAQERVVATIPRAVGEQFNPTAEFLVQLADESLGASGLLPGDRIAVCGTEQPRTGEIVVARTACEIAVQRVVEIDQRRIVLAQEDAEAARCA